MAWTFWEKHRRVPWAWAPTVQGWKIEDYRFHARQLHPLLEAMKAHYGNNSFWRVGIGTLCRRVSATLIWEIVSTVSYELPGIPLHLWGVKLAVLKSHIALPKEVVSVDSAAWNGFFGRGHEKRRQSLLTKREYAYQVALPEYLKKVSMAISGSKQIKMFFPMEEDVEDVEEDTKEVFDDIKS